MADPYYTILKGNVLRAEWQVKSFGSFLAPSVITCKTLIDGGSPVSQVVLTDGDGRYHADIDTSSMTAGTYTVSWLGTGTAIAKAEMRFVIEEALVS